MEIFFFIPITLGVVVLALMSVALAPLIMIALIAIIVVLSILPWHTIGAVLGIGVFLFILIGCGYGSYLRIRDWVRTGYC